jgi:iron complex outermembrane recepter protein
MKTMQIARKSDVKERGHTMEKFHQLAGVASLALVAAGTQAHAETGAGVVQSASAGQAGDSEAESTEDEGDVILVRAQRRDEDILTVPVAVTALGGETLSDRGVVTTQDLTFVTPGLVVAPALSRDVPAFVIRGQQRLASGQGAPAVVTYFADVPMSVQGSLLPTFDIGSVQVLKGPQGTLFGRNTTGGAVLVYPVSPDYDVGGYVKATYGEYDERTLEGAINIPVVADKLAVRLAGQVARRDGYTINVANGLDLDDRHTNALRASVLFEPSDAFTNSTVVDFYEAKENGTATVLSAVYPNEAVPIGGTPRSFPFRLFYDNGAPATDVDLILAAQANLGIRQVNFDFPTRSNRKIWGVTNTTEIDLGAVTFKNIFGYRSTFVDSSRDFDGTPLTINGQSNFFERDQITSEFQLLGDVFDGRLEYILGFFYLDERPIGANSAANDTFAVAAIGRGRTFGETYIREKSKAVFGQLTFELADGLKVSGGLRNTWDDIQGCTSPGGAATVISGSFANCKSTYATRVTNTESSALTYSLGVNYTASDSLFLYAVTRRGYRAAGPNGEGFAASIEEFENYQPETITDYEIGLKSDFDVLGAKATFNISAYISKLEDYQQTLIPGPNFDGDGIASNDPFSLVFNVAEATITGFEADVSLRLSPNLTVGGFLNHTDAGFDRFPVSPALLPALVSIPGADPVNNRLSYVPAWTGGVSLDATAPVPSIGDVALNVNVYRSGQLQFNGRPNDIAAIENGYTIVSAKIGFDDVFGSGVSIKAYARNLFNEVYASAGGFVSPVFTTATTVYGEPRVVGVEVGFRF